MEDYPRTIQEFEDRFRTEEACRDYLAAHRWPDGFRCPKCGKREMWKTSRGLFHCTKCNRQTSVLAGTIYQGSHIPLRTWFRAIWWLTSQKTGASAMSLHKILGLGSYKTAWSMLQKLRRAMIRPGREKLHGRVEVDETFLGGEEKGKRGRGAGKKVLVLIAAEEAGEKKIGRIRMKRVSDASGNKLVRFVLESVEPGSTVHTDGWQGYSGIGKKGYKHEVTELKYCDPGDEMLPRVHLVASLLKRWVRGTLQGSVSRKHLDYYLDEFVFRFNRRTSRHRGKLFYRLVQNSVKVAPSTFKNMVWRGRGRPRRRPLYIGGT